MLKGITAIGILLLSGFNYLKPIQETYTNLEGIYTISMLNDTESIPLKTNEDFRIVIYDSQELTPIADLTEQQSYELNYNGTDTIRIRYLVRPPSIFENYTLTDTTDSLYNYVYFHNVKIKADQKTFNLVKQNDISGNYILNKTYNLKNFNPVGFLNHNYSENFLIPSAIQTPIDILGDYYAIYKGNRVVSMTSTWINAQGSYIQTNNQTYKIALVEDNNNKLYMYTTIVYYDTLAESNKTEYISNAVYDNRISENKVVGTYLTNKLNNVNESLYILGRTSEQDITPQYNISTFFEYYDITNGSGITIDGGIGDVFSLLSQCFMGIGGFFGIALIPGITLGALFFLPFIVSLIIWLINIFKRH